MLGSLGLLRLFKRLGNKSDQVLDRFLKTSMAYESLFLSFSVIFSPLSNGCVSMLETDGALGCLELFLRPVSRSDKVLEWVLNTSSWCVSLVEIHGRLRLLRRPVGRSDKVFDRVLKTLSCSDMGGWDSVWDRVLKASPCNGV